MQKCRSGFSHSHAGQVHGKECTEASNEGARDMDACTIMINGVVPTVLKLLRPLLTSTVGVHEL